MSQVGRAPLTLHFFIMGRTGHTTVAVGYDYLEHPQSPEILPPDAGQSRESCSRPNLERRGDSGASVGQGREGQSLFLRGKI